MFYQFCGKTPCSVYIVFLEKTMDTYLCVYFVVNVKNNLSRMHLKIAGEGFPTDAGTEYDLLIAAV
jgi:hypothetical protein